MSEGRVGHEDSVAAGNWFAFEDSGDTNGSLCGLARQLTRHAPISTEIIDTRKQANLRGHNSNSISRSGLSVMYKLNLIRRHVD